MRIAICGWWDLPACTFATLWKKRHPESRRCASTSRTPPMRHSGFGVVFSDRALEFLRGDDPETHDLITPEMETWQNMTLIHKGETVTIDGVGFSSIGRLKLLQLLQERAHRGRCRSGHFETDHSDSVDELPEWADLIIAVRRPEFGGAAKLRGGFPRHPCPTCPTSSGGMAWKNVVRFTHPNLCRDRPTGRLTRIITATRRTMSTFLVECGRETWLNGRTLATKSDEESRALCSEICSPTPCRGKPLISNKSTWRNFPAALERPLVPSEHGAGGRCPAYGPFFDRVGYPPRDGRRYFALVEALEAEPGDVPVCAGTL